MLFSYERQKKESNGAKLILNFIGAFQTIPENSLHLGAFYVSRNRSLRLTLWQPRVIALPLAGQWRWHQICQTFQKDQTFAKQLWKLLYSYPTGFPVFGRTRQILPWGKKK